MIVTALLAGLFSVRSLRTVIVLAFVCPVLALIGARWLLSREYRRHAAICFGIVATTVNALYAASCVYPIAIVLIILFVLLFLTVPIILSFGVAWATMATKETALPRRSPLAAWLLVIAVTVMPLATLWTLWPFRVFFLAVKPSMEILADRVVAGRAIVGPQWVGPFRIVGSAFDPASGKVCLWIDSSPNHPSGFVRRGPRAPSRSASDVMNLDLYISGRWWYREED